MLTKEKKEYFKNWLTQRLNELTGKTQEIFEYMTDFNVKLPDEIDQASMELDRSLTLSVKDRERKLIGKIKDALERLEEGTYGICEECGEEIPEKRLMVRPMASLCIECKKEKEATEKFRTLNQDPFELSRF